MLEIKNVSKIYGTGNSKVTALKNISIDIEKGEFVAVMGPSGSGKSTFLNIIGGLDRLSEGQVILNGQRLDNLNEDALVDIRRGKIGYVFQL
jgi:putative ABC transport system ATP-binding protein